MKMLVPLIATMLVLSGCASQERIVASGSDVATIELSQAALTVNKSLQDLAATDQETPLKVKKIALDPNAIGMGRLATVNWSGPAEPLLKKLAALSRYRVKVFGKEPALPVLVSVNEREQYLGDILRQVSLQSSDQMRVLVYPSSKLIELHYLSN